jgi:hypothetical protein
MRESISKRLCEFASQAASWLTMLSVICLSSSARATPQSYFPEGIPWLGGSEWERRLSTELRAGSWAPEGARARSLAGVATRLFWGPWLSLEADLRAVSPLQGGAALRTDLLMPLRIPWSASESLAPLAGYSLEKAEGAPLLGLQVRWRVWRLSLLTQAVGEIQAREGRRRSRFTQQVEYVVEAGERLHSFLGVRYDREWTTLDQPRTGGDQVGTSTEISLVSGVRF